MQEIGLSEPKYKIQVERNVPIRMRDGTILRADIYRPETEGKYPVIVERVAYELVGRCTSNGEYFASRGYVFVGQNVRGTFASEGDWRPFRDDGWGANRDGYDTIEWAGAQPGPTATWNGRRLLLWLYAVHGRPDPAAAPESPLCTGRRRRLL